MDKDQVQPASHQKQLGGDSTQEEKGVSMKPPSFSLEAGPVKSQDVPQVDTSKFSKVELFIYKYAEPAHRLEQSHGVPALVTLAQGALESGWGKSAIGNNLFGIKAGKKWEGKKKLVTTHEFHDTNDKGDRYPEVISIEKVSEGKNAGKYKYTVKDYFRDYDTVEEGLLDHSQFLNKYERYAAAFNTETPDDFALAVAAGGYATSPTYGEKLIAVMNTVRNHWPSAAGTIPAGNAKQITGGRPVKTQNATAKTVQKPTQETTKIDPIAKSGKYQILQTVGNGAINQSADILVVKALLIKAGYPVLMIPTMDAQDIDHIKAFQKKTFGWRSPDGVVDPGGKTFQALAGGQVKSEKTQSSPEAKPKITAPTGIDIASVAERLYAAMHKTFFGTGFGSNEGEIVAALELLNRDAQKIEALKKVYLSKYNKDLVADLKSELTDFILWGTQESGALGLLSPKNPQQTQHNSGTTTQHSGQKAAPQQQQSGKLDDSTTSRKIESMFDSYANMRIKHGDKTVSVVAPYYINSDKSGRKSRAEGARAGDTGVQKLLRDLRASGKIQSTALVAKSTRSELVAILEEAVNRGLVDHDSSAMHKFLSKYGLSTDCSGFVSQTLNFLMDGNKVVDDKDNFDPDNTNAASLKGGQGEITKISRSELKPGDTMHLNGHIRIIVEAKTEDKIIYYKTAESTAKEHGKTGQDGFMKRWWKFDGTTQYSSFENPNGLHPASDDANWVQTTESNTFGRYKKLG